MPTATKPKPSNGPPSLWRIDPKARRLEFSFHDGQRAAWDSTARFVFMLAGTQGGKTTFGPWWLAREIRRCGPGDYLAVSSTVDLARLKMLPALREAFEFVLKAAEWRASDRMFVLPDPDTGKLDPNAPWGRVILRSAASDSGLESATAKAAWLDECGQEEFSLETWEAVLRRLSLSQGRVLGTTTPYNLGWLKTHVYDRHAAGDPLFDVIQFASTRNPAFPEAEYQRARDTMPEWRFRMFYEGKFTRPAGLVYDVYDEARHMVEDFAPPAAWPRYAGVDFGAVNTATVWLAHDQDTDTYFAYRETHEGGLTTSQHCGHQLQHMKDAGITEAYWHGGAGSEDQQRRDWTEQGVYVQKPLIPSVEAGIDRVVELFRTDKLRICRGCTGLRAELGSYRRECDADGNPTEKLADKDIYHRLDALRYVASALSLGPVRYGGSVWDPAPPKRDDFLAAFDAIR